ncbi:MAG: hypothetical protein ACTHNS_08815 [Marmoricola sp.]
MTTTTRTTDSDTTTHDGHLSMGDRLHVPRSRGATSGTLLVILGIWGGLVPFLGPVFGYAFTPDTSWTMTWGRLWLEVLPAAATFLGGLILLGTGNRVTGHTGAWLGVAGGAWFIVGQTISRLWTGGSPQAGMPASSSTLGQVAEQIGFFTGLGAVILFLAAAAMGRMSVVAYRDVRALGRRETVVPDQRAAHRAPVTEERAVEE